MSDYSTMERIACLAGSDSVEPDGSLWRGADPATQSYARPPTPALTHSDFVASAPWAACTSFFIYTISFAFQPALLRLLSYAGQTSLRLPQPNFTHAPYCIGVDHQYRMPMITTRRAPDFEIKVTPLKNPRHHE